MLYTGKIVLKGILADQLYDHFMVFNVDLSLLLCPTLAVDHNSYSKELMKLKKTVWRLLHGVQCTLNGTSTRRANGFWQF